MRHCKEGGRRLLKVIICSFSFHREPRLSRNDTVNSFIYLLQLAGRVCVATLPPTVQQYVPTFFKLWIWLWVLLILSLQMNSLFYLESIKPVHAWKTLEGGMRNGYVSSLQRLITANKILQKCNTFN